MKALTRFWRSLVLAEYSKSMGSPEMEKRGGLRLLGELPGQLGHRPGALGGIDGLLAGGGAGLDALGDALQDRGHAEEVVGLVEVPVGRQRLGRADAGALAVAADVLALGRDAQRR